MFPENCSNVFSDDLVLQADLVSEPCLAILVNLISSPITHSTIHWNLYFKHLKIKFSQLITIPQLGNTFMYLSQKILQNNNKNNKSLPPTFCYWLYIKIMTFLVLTLYSGWTLLSNVFFLYPSKYCFPIEVKSNSLQRIVTW